MADESYFLKTLADWNWKNKNTKPYNRLKQHRPFPDKEIYTEE